MTINSDVRVQMLLSDDTDVLPEAYVTLMVADAKDQTTITDENNRALRYYVCYLIATNWDSLDAVRSREGVTYKDPDPQKYFDLYEKQITSDLSKTTNGQFYAAKISTTKGNIIDDEGRLTSGTYEDQFNQ